MRFYIRNAMTKPRINHGTSGASILLMMLFAFLAYGCNPVNQNEVFIANGLRFNILPVQPFVTPRTLSQSVDIEYAGNYHKIISRLEIHEMSFNLVGMSAIGIPLFNIKGTDDIFAIEKTPILPSNFDIRFLLADLQLVYWPLELINQQLLPQNASIRLKNEGDGREIYMADEKIIDIVFSNDSDWNKDIIYSHFQRKYTIRITTLAVE